MTSRKTIALTRRTFVGKVMSLLFNMLSRLVLTFLLRSKHLLTSWLQSPSAVILQKQKTEVQVPRVVHAQQASMAGAGGVRKGTRSHRVQP